MADVYDVFERRVGSVSYNGIVTDAHGNRVGHVAGIDSASSGGTLCDAAGYRVGDAIGMNSVSVSATIDDADHVSVGEVVGLRSVAGRCSVQDREGRHAGWVGTSHPSAVGAALLLLPLLQPGARRVAGQTGLTPDTGTASTGWTGSTVIPPPPRRGWWKVAVPVLVILAGAGAFLGIRLASSANAGSSSGRLSLGGVSAAIPAGWKVFDLPASQHAAAARIAAIAASIRC